MDLFRFILVTGLLILLSFIIEKSYSRLRNEEVATVVKWEERPVSLPSITICMETLKRTINSFNDIEKSLKHLEKQLIFQLRVSKDYTEQ